MPCISTLETNLTESLINRQTNLDLENPSSIQHLPMACSHALIRGPHQKGALHLQSQQGHSSWTLLWMLCSLKPTLAKMLPTQYREEVRTNRSSVMVPSDGPELRAYARAQDRGIRILRHSEYTTVSSCFGQSETKDSHTQEWGHLPHQYQNYL